MEEWPGFIIFMYKQFKEIKKKYKNKRGESEGFIDIA
jgi:hypothetical protein